MADRPDAVQPAAAEAVPESPDDHRRFSLSEDWTATAVGLLIFAACMLGVITPEMIP